MERFVLGLCSTYIIFSTFNHLIPPPPPAELNSIRNTIMYRSTLGKWWDLKFRLFPIMVLRGLVPSTF